MVPLESFCQKQTKINYKTTMATAATAATTAVATTATEATAATKPVSITAII